MLESIIRIGPIDCPNCRHYDIRLRQLLAEVSRPISQEAVDAMHGELYAQVTGLMALDPQKESYAGRELLRIATIVEAYEKVRWPMGKATSDVGAPK